MRYNPVQCFHNIFKWLPHSNQIRSSCIFRHSLHTSCFIDYKSQHKRDSSQLLKCHVFCVILCLWFYPLSYEGEYHITVIWPGNVCDLFRIQRQFFSLSQSDEPPLYRLWRLSTCPFSQQPAWCPTSVSRKEAVFTLGEARASPAGAPLLWNFATSVHSPHVCPMKGHSERPLLPEWSCTLTKCFSVKRTPTFWQTAEHIWKRGATSGHLSLGTGLPGDRRFSSCFSDGHFSEDCLMNLGLFKSGLAWKSNDKTGTITTIEPTGEARVVGQSNC